MVKFITLAGKKQTGKDTSAQYIKHTLVSKGVSENSVHVVHFADALKRACYFIFGISLEDMETETGKQKLTDVRWPRYEIVVTNGGTKKIWVPDPNGKFMTVREVLQFIGSDMFRCQIDPDIWVRSVYRKKYKEDDIVIVADCRFPNEAEFAKNHGLLLFVDRDTGLASDGHMSETALNGYSNYDYQISNHSSFMNLYKQLNDILKERKII